MPGQKSETAAPSDKRAGAKDRRKKNRLQLDVSPVTARPMERMNLTGTYRGADNVGLQVQRFEDGSWQDFGVSATVRVGTFETYVMTGRSGQNRFRMWRPGSGGTAATSSR